MAGLLITQQIACAANVEIVAGKLEARAERIQARKHLQALFGGFGDGPVGRRRQIGISARLCPAHAAAKLIELCERTEEHTSELQSLMRISYAVFCLKKKKN